MEKTIVLALGGNAIAPATLSFTFQDQLNNIQSVCKSIVVMVREGYRVVVVHGNGPQIGHILLKQELSKHVVPPIPLDVCVSDTQGSVGYAFQQTLTNILRQEELTIPVATLITQVLVDANDAAFRNPTKPIGPFFNEQEAHQLAQEKSYRMKHVGKEGWRRVVPSPTPLEICEKDSIKYLLNCGCIVIAAGGGGIPVARDTSGRLYGVEAVIDKDLAGQELAKQVGAEMFFILTNVDRVSIDFGKPSQKDLEQMTLAQARRWMEEGQFPSGSMGPKVEAACRFVASGGKEAIIGPLNDPFRAVKGLVGTRIVRE